MASSSLSIANEFSSVRILNAGEEAEGNVNAEQQVDADETIIRRHDFLKERIWFGNVIVFGFFCFDGRYFMIIFRSLVMFFARKGRNNE